MKKINLGKKLMTLLLATIILATNTLVANSATKEAVWQQFRGNSLNPGVTDSKTPITSAEIQEDWSVKIGSGWSFSDPIIVGDYVYTTDSSNIKKYDKETGKLLLEKPLLEGIGYFSRMAYGEGKLFIPVGKGRIQCLDANTLESLWITEENPDEMGLQAISPVTYSNGYVYMGASNGDASNGIFYAVTAIDEDTSKVDEIKNYTWSYVPKTGAKGYYWSTATIVNNAVIFGGENGQVISHSPNSNNVLDTIEINEPIRSSIHYDRELGRIYIASKAGNIFSVKVNPDGTFDELSLLKTKIGSNITSSPVTYNGRVYIASGGMGSTGGFSVLDANTLDIIYQINEITSQSSPILTTAYSTEENKNTVYLYVFKYDTPDYIYVVKDYEGNTTPSYEVLATPSEAQYNSSSAAIDEDGSIYFKNDSGNLFKFSNKVNGEFTLDDIISVIDRLPEIDDISLNDEIAINNILFRYNALSEEDKEKVTNIDKLNEAIKKIEDLKNVDKEVDRLLEEIDNLPLEIILDNKDKVKELFNRYNNLSEEYKAKITNSDKLISANNKILELEEIELINSIENKIDRLPLIEDVVLDREEEINTLYKEFITLSEDVQNKVSNKEKLINSKEKVDSIRKEVASIEDDIWNKIDPTNITLADKEVINDLIERYNALDERDRKYIHYFDEVLEAKKIIDKLEAEDNKGSINDNSSSTDNSEIDTESSTETNNNGESLPETGGVDTRLVFATAVLIMIFGFVLLRKDNKKTNNN